MFCTRPRIAEMAYSRPRPEKQPYTVKAKLTFLCVIKKRPRGTRKWNRKNREPLTVYNGMDCWLDHSSFTNKLVLNPQFRG